MRWLRQEEQVRRQAAAWFARLRGPNADRHRAAFGEWLARDADHRLTYDRLVRRWDDVPALRGSDVASQLKRSDTEARSPRWKPVALAASVLLVVAVSGVLLQDRLTQARSGVGRLKTITLAHGARVILDADSTLSTLNSHDRRLRLLRGRARFILPPLIQPFHIQAGESDFIGSGTIVDVDMEENNTIQVDLLKGGLEVRRRDLLNTLERRPGWRLAAGQEAVMVGAVAAVSPVAPESTQWTLGLLTYAEAPLSKVVAQANRYSTDKIRFTPASLGNLHVTGVFNAGHSRQLAASVAASFGLNVSVNAGGDLTLSRERL